MTWWLPAQSCQTDWGNEWCCLKTINHHSIWQIWHLLLAKNLYVCVRAGAESDESHLVAADHDHQWFQCELLAESTYSSLASVHEKHKKKLASEWSGVEWRGALPFSPLMQWELMANTSYSDWLSVDWYQHQPTCQSTLLWDLSLEKLSRKRQWDEKNVLTYI